MSARCYELLKWCFCHFQEKCMGNFKQTEGVWMHGVPMEYIVQHYCLCDSLVLLLQGVWYLSQWQSPNVDTTRFDGGYQVKIGVLPNLGLWGKKSLTWKKYSKAMEKDHLGLAVGTVPLEWLTITKWMDGWMTFGKSFGRNIGQLGK